MIRWRQALLLGLVGGTLLWALGFPTLSWGSRSIDYVWCVGCMGLASVLVDVLKGRDR